MKKASLILCAVLFCVATVSTYASSDFDLSQLNPALVPLFEAIGTDSKAEDQLIGKTISMDVSIRLASTNHLLFEDGYVIISPDTRYAFLKFERGMTIPQAFDAGDQATIEFEILSIEQGPVTGNLPHLTVRLLSIEKQSGA